MKTPHRFLLAGLLLLVGLNIADAVLTWYAIRIGIGTEANPVMASLIAVGWPTFFAAKAAGMVFVATVIWGWRGERAATVLTTISVLAYIVVVANNIMVVSCG